jgi:glycerophosphoryl diester phosphodiesterase
MAAERWVSSDTLLADRLPARTLSRSRRRFLDWPGPIPFAHAGGGNDHPWNTIPAFRAAVAAGYVYLETDVHLTLDGVVVAFHDDVLDRVTDRRGRVADLTAAELATVDAGYGFTTDGGRTFPHRGKGLVIPRLSDILEEWPQVRMNIDAKSDAVVEPLARLLRRMDALGRVCVGSFVDRRVRHFRRSVDDAVCTSMGQAAAACARVASVLGRVPHLGADCVQLPVRRHGVALVDDAMVRAAHRCGLPVHVWTIDEPAEMERLLDLGVDGIMTNRPAVLRDVLRRRGAWWSG